MEKQYISCDGAYSFKTFLMQYRAYLMPEKKLILDMSFPEGTNNIAEFLGIVGSLQYIKENNLNIPVYSDSVCALGWVKNKKMNTKMIGMGVDLALEITKAEQWLKDNKHGTIKKWDTRRLGQVEADYGLK